MKLSESGYGGEGNKIGLCFNRIFYSLLIDISFSLFNMNKLRA